MKAAERFFAEVIAEYGITEGDIVRIPMTQCELARRRKRAASTVGAYLSAMGPRVMRRSPEIVLSSRPREAAEPAEMDEVDELLVAYRDLVAAQARVIELQAARGSAGSARGSRGIGREPREVQEQEGQEAPSPCSAREDPRADRAEPAAWTDSELDTVLAPLHEVVRRAGLQAMNNRPRLTAALRPYTLDQVEHAVSELVRGANDRGTKVRSPFGLLHTWATTGAMPNRPAPVPPPAAAATDLEPVDDDVRAAVAGLSPADLAALDAFVDAQLGGLVRMPPAMRQATRLTHYRLWAATSTPDGDHQVTTSTPRGVHEDTPSTQGAHP